MFQGICEDILNAKWTELSCLNYPITASKIAAAECLSESIRQFFFAEISHYCKRLLFSLVDTANISHKLLGNSDATSIESILYDWVEFSEQEAYDLLKFAIETELFFLVSPTKCLPMFMFHAAGVLKPTDTTEDENVTEERRIELILEELDFLSDKQHIIKALRDELEELTNIQSTVTLSKFTDLVNDIVFNLYQKQTIRSFLLPIKHFLEFWNSDDIPIGFVEMFLVQRDLAGIYTEIKKYADENEKDSFKYEEIYDELKKMLNLEDEELEILEEQVEEAETEFSETPSEEIVKSTSIDDESEFSADIVVPGDFEEFVQAVEQEVDDTILQMESEGEALSTTISPDIQAIYDSREELNQQIAEMRANSVTPLEIARVYLEMEAKHISKINNVLCIK